jgi:hypothetical protein
MGAQVYSTAWKAGSSTRFWRQEGPLQRCSQEKATDISW